MKIRQLLLSLILLSILIVSCEKEGKRVEYTPKLAPNTKVLDAAVNQNLSAIDSVSLTFTGSDSEIEDIKIGDILAADISNNAPAGYLRKVIDIQKNGNTTKLVTEQAAIVDAVEEGEFTFSRGFSASDIVLEDTTGIDLSERAGDIIIKIDKVIYDEDNNPNTKNDQIKAKGEYKITQFEVDFDYKIRDYELDKMLFQVRMERQTSMTFTATSANISFKKEVTIASFQLPPYIVPGPIPLPFAEQFITIKGGVDGSLTLNVEVKTTDAIITTNGMRYNKTDGWETISEEVSDPNVDKTDVNITLVGTARAYIRTQYVLRPYFYENAQFSIWADVYAKFKVDYEIISQEYKWKLLGGISFSALLKLEIFSKILVNLELKDVLSIETTLAEGSSVKSSSPEIGSQFYLLSTSGAIERYIAVKDGFVEMIKFTGTASDKKIYLNKYNDNGTQLWNINVSNLDVNSAYDVGNPSITAKEDGSGYIVALAYYHKIYNSPQPVTYIHKYWIFEVSNSGNIIWQNVKNIGFMAGSTYDYTIYVTVSEKNGSIYLHAHAPLGSYYLVKANSSSILWEKTIPNPLFRLVPISNNEILTSAVVNNDIVISKYNSNGTQVWSNTYGGSNLDEVRDIAENVHGEYIITGSTDSDDGDMTANKGNYDVWVAKLASDGTLIWQKSLGGLDLDVSEEIVALNDTTYTIAGYSKSSDGDLTENNGEFDLWVFNIKDNGTLNWQKSYGTTKFEKTLYANCFSITNDGGYHLVAQSYTPSNTGDYWFLKIKW